MLVYIKMSFPEQFTVHTVSRTLVKYCFLFVAEHTKLNLFLADFKFDFSDYNDVEN